ncbi:MAG TPA: SH3 domain-containing protein [Burkholderiaceae bacterium]|jgi:SH3-like domain-containing protein|nr:SH3 domain-containing protein [Burkholderiaceae bacterium]
MKYFRKLVFCATPLLLAFTSAQALEYKSVGSDPAVAYDAPGAKGRKVFVAPRGMPVETILTYGDWTKVRDSAGDLFWLESKVLTPKRMLVVKVASAKVRASADDSGALTFSADKGVLLELAEPATSGWLKVKHRDGQSGYVKATEVWGGE